MTKRSTPQAASFLLVTKLHRPVTSAPLVPRPRLLETLTAGLNQRLTLISAPAGYGKTTVVNQWLDSLDLPCAWLSLDEFDSDPATFLSYLLAAVRSAYPDAALNSEVLIRAPSFPSPNRLADTLLTDLAALPGPLILVLDDYHMIQTADVHTIMTRLVQHMPAHVHLVLATRADPPLHLERLRGRQQLTELRGADLSFTTEEAGQLLRQMFGPTITDEITALLSESTEGWPAGLQLACISLRGRSDPAAFAKKIAQGNQTVVADYLLAEVLQGLPEAQRTGLLQTSLLDRFCAPLCDAIRGEASPKLAGEEFLHGVRQSNLFLKSLDDEGTWFRYHRLFQYLLRTRAQRFYSDAEIKEMHARASAWFVAHGLLDEAIVHAVQAGDGHRAAVLVEEHVHPAFDREDWRQVERWLKLLPTDALSRPRLLTAQAWLQFVHYQPTAMVTLLDAAENVMAGDPATGQAIETPLRGEINALRATVAYSQGDIAGTLRFAQAALQQLPPDMQFAFSQASAYHIFGLRATGRYSTAVEYGHAQIAAAHGRQAELLAMRLITALVSIDWEMAEVSALRADATTLLQVATHAGFPASMAWANLGLGWANYLQNKLAAAERNFKDLVSIIHAVHSRAMINGYTGLVLTALALGRPHEALATIAALREQLLERGLAAYVPIIDSLQQRVALVCEPSSALDWHHHSPATPLPFEFVEQPTLTRVRTLLARGAPADLAQAAELLTETRAKETARSNHRRLIEVGALEALVCAGQENETAALAALQEAVERAAPGGALRLLVDCGPGLIGLLQKLHSSGVAPNYIEQVLAVFDSSAVLAPAPIPGRDSKGSARGPDELVERLTNREIDVLILLAERLSDKEIANRLVLSPGTVRKHTLHIYSKLGVNNRRAAVAQARRLGLI